jgi:hypothetical protein
VNSVGGPTRNGSPCHRIAAHRIAEHGIAAHDGIASIK